MVSVPAVPSSPWRPLRLERSLRQDPNRRAWTQVELEELEVVRLRVVIVDLYKLEVWDEQRGSPQRQLEATNETQLVCLLSAVDEDLRDAVLRAWSWRLERVQANMPRLGAEVLEEASRRG